MHINNFFVLGGKGASFGELMEKANDDSVCTAAEMVGVGSNEEGERLLVSVTASFLNALLGYSSFRRPI